MPFVLKKYKAIQGSKIQCFLLDEAGLSSSESQRLLAKNRVFDDQGDTLKNGQVVKGEYIQVAVFEGQTKGLRPIFEADDFAVFDKPSGLMVHPTRKETQYCLLDEVRYHFGNGADLVHRIDAETSGLVLVSKNKQATSVLKTMFENKEYSKKYLALVRGEINSDLSIDKPIAKSTGAILLKMTCNTKQGKNATTRISPIKYNQNDDTTLVEVTPITGRQHQIRVHLDAINHAIIGDPIYGVSEDVAGKYLSKDLSEDDRLKFTGANRLMLHANKLSFSYNGKDYAISSKVAHKVFKNFENN